MRKAIVFATVLFLFALPYLIFEGKLFIGGDDTRMLYAYPKEFMKAMSLYSWSNVSSLSYYNPSFHFLPFLLIWEALYFLVGSRVVINYAAFSLPFVLGFVYIRKFLIEIFDSKYFWETYLSALFFILSPILIITQFVVFLTPAYLIGLFPVLAYHYVKYVKTGKRKFVLHATLWACFFSFTLYTFAWIFGLLMPLVVAALIVPLFIKGIFIRKIFNRTIYFCLIILLTQLFWIIPFASTFIFSSKMSGATVFSSGVSNTFVPTILATATGNIVYPLLNLFHRQIIMDFGWQYATQYKFFYDKILLANIFFPALVILGIYNAKKVLRKEKYKIFLFFLMSFLTSLYLFTINISILKTAFLLLGNIPGFVMFRNYFDKFSIGFVFLYSIVIAASLIVVLKGNKQKRLIFAIFFILIIINAMPIKSIVNGPLWRTENFYKTVDFNYEYLEMVEYVKKHIGKENSIFTIPYNAAAYAVIPNNHGDGGYIGTSPMKILSGVNDITGTYSFSSEKANEFNSFILERKYKEIKEFLFAHNINYVLTVNNLSVELKNGYFFDEKIVKYQDSEFVKNITDKLVFSTSRSSYQLFQTKSESAIFSESNISFKKVNDAKYLVKIVLPKDGQIIKFKDAYHPGWKLYDGSDIAKCYRNSHDKYDNCYHNNLFDFSEIKYIFQKSYYDDSHKPDKVFGNTWVVNGVVKEKELNLILFFHPQLYFYAGLVLTIIAFVLQSLLLWKKNWLKRII